MPYVNNLPRRNRPRGLGDVAERASSNFGTWVVDNFWGLSPKNISGQPRPYGQTVVQTFLPRTDQPRLMNLHMGPVIPGGSWPTLRRMNNNPVFRTPVDRPGAVQTSLPPGASNPMPSQVAVDGYGGGYGGGGDLGWIPMGIATPPRSLLERPGLQGFGDYGEPVSDSLTIQAGGQTITFDASDLEFIRANERQLRNIFIQVAQTYAARVQQLELLNNAMLYLSASIQNLQDRMRAAQLLVFGDPLYPNDPQRAAANHQAAVREVAKLTRMRSDLAAQATNVESWPADVAGAYSVLMNRQAPGTAPAALGLGAAGAAIASVSSAVWWGVATVAALITAGAAYKGIQWATREAGETARINAANAQAEMNKALAATERARAQAIHKLTVVMQTAPTVEERIAAMNKLAEMGAAHDAAKAKRASDKKALNTKGPGEIAFYGAILMAGLLSLRYYFGAGAPPRGKKKKDSGGGGGGGGGGGREPREGRERARKIVREPRLIAPE